ncbi:MAG: transcriptional repressor [Bdellovibrio sp.]|nr:transcriptional repressor [Bdellovibrio sp.]
MKKHKELVSFLKSKGLRMTPSKEKLVQFFLYNQARHIPIKEIQDQLISTLPDVDRTTIYRNIEKFISLGLIQELDLPKKGKVYQFVFDKKVQHYYICKSCGKMNKGNEDLFKKIEKALKDIHDFSKANLSVLFYGFCSKCENTFENEANL